MRVAPGLPAQVEKKENYEIMVTMRAKIDEIRKKNDEEYNDYIKRDRAHRGYMREQRRKKWVWPGRAGPPACCCSECGLAVALPIMRRPPAVCTRRCHLLGDGDAFCTSRTAGWSRRGIARVRVCVRVHACTPSSCRHARQRQRLITTCPHLHPLCMLQV